MTVDVDTYQKTGQATKVITHHYEAYGNVVTSSATYSNLVREVINDDGQVGYIWWNASPIYPVLQASGSNVILYRPSLTNIKGPENKSSIHIYPNPATNHINIAKERTVQKLEIYNAAGALMLTTTQSVVSLTDFISGIYFIKAYTQEGIERHSFIKL